MLSDFPHFQNYLIFFFLFFFQMRLMRSIRESIKQNRFPEFVKDFMRINYPDGQFPLWIVESLSSVNITLDR